jgi:hypothetical protein
LEYSKPYQNVLQIIGHRLLVCMEADSRWLLTARVCLSSKSQWLFPLLIFVPFVFQSWAQGVVGWLGSKSSHF